MIYIGLFVALLCLRWALNGNLEGRHRVYPVVLAVLFIFSAFRFEVGCDWTGYLNQFQVNQFQSMESLGGREALWWALIAALRNLDLPYPWLNVASSAIFFLGVHVLARRQPDPFSFLVLLYPVLILNMPLSGIRQAAAIGVVCIAFAALFDNRLIKFIVLVVVAAALHASAAIFLLLAPFARGQFSAGRVIAAIVIGAPASVLLLSGEAEFAASRYVGQGSDAFGAVFRLAALTLTGIYFLLVLRVPWKIQFPQDYKLALLGSLGMTPLIFLVLVSTVIGDRIGYYFVPLQAMIFARAPHMKALPAKELFTVGPYLALLAMLSVWVLTSGLFQQCYQPYSTWLFGFPDFPRWPF